MKNLNKLLLVGTVALSFNAHALDANDMVEINNAIANETNRAIRAENEAYARAENADGMANYRESLIIQDLTNETNRATTAEALNSQAISNETNRAMIAEASNRQAITNETNRATAAEALLRQETRQVGAMSMAAAAAAGAGGSMVTEAKPTSVSVAVGTYSSYGALALGVTHRVRENIRMYGTVSGGTSGKTGVGVGAAFSF